MVQAVYSKAIYKFHLTYGRQGDLNGVFIRDKYDVDTLLNHKLEVYFGEVLGKHSEIITAMKDAYFTFVTDDPRVVELFEEYDLSTGFNPFHYYSHNFDFERYGIPEEDLEIGELVDLIIKKEIERDYDTV